MQKVETMHTNYDHNIGEKMHGWARDLWPINRSLTGPGVRETLEYLKARIPDLVLHSVPSGTSAFDWKVPNEWSVTEAYLEHESGERVIDIKNNNLHLLGYSDHIDAWLDLEDLQEHLFSLPEQPSAIPYVTSYYSRRWGFCLSQDDRKALKPGRYHAVIKSTLEPGEFNFADLVLPGETQDEIFLSTYICHPSMANNELSGPVVALALAQWLSSLETRKYTYRIVFIPETLGSLVYLSRNLDTLKSKTLAGFNITCVGDERSYSYLPSRNGETLSDRVAKHVLGNLHPNYARYTWLQRGSDERQYCAPGIDLPIASMMRTKYGEYPEYHTSLDDLSLVTPNGLEGGYWAHKRAIECIELNCLPIATVLGEPQLGSRGLYPTISKKNSVTDDVALMMDTLSYCDGTRDLLDISDLIGHAMWDVRPVVDKLVENNLLKLA